MSGSTSFRPRAADSAHPRPQVGPQGHLQAAERLAAAEAGGTTERLHCESCRTEVAELGRVLSALDAWDVGEPSPAVRVRVNERVDAAVAGAERQQVALLGVLGLALAAAAGILILHEWLATRLWSGWLAGVDPHGVVGALATLVTALGFGTLLSLMSAPLLLRRGRAGWTATAVAAVRWRA